MNEINGMDVLNVIDVKYVMDMINENVIRDLWYIMYIVYNVCNLFIVYNVCHVFSGSNVCDVFIV